MNDLVYDALMLGRNKYVAREEYLTAKGEKKPVAFEAQEHNLYLSNITSDTSGIIHLKMLEEGFAEIEVFSEDSFIILDRKVITSDDFTDGEYALTFEVKADKLHDGRNFAMILFRTPICTSQTRIIVHNQIVAAVSDQKQRRAMASVYRDYLDLRLGNLFQTEWQERALKSLADISGSDRTDLFLYLYKASVLISMERFEEAHNLIEFVSGQITKISDSEWNLISYYMYISSLYEGDDDATSKSLERIRELYDEYPSWIILWVLFYMDEELSNSPREMIADMEGEFLLRDCNSPAIYYEAAEVYRRDPELITELSDFALQTLLFAAREDFLNIEIAIRVADIVWQTDEYLLEASHIRTAIRVLKAAYDRFESHMVLKSLCKLLVCADERGSEYHIYFADAIRAFLETRDIYNYFIYTADQDSFTELPEAVLEHFVGRESSLGEYRAYYFASLISNKDRYGSYYGKYIGCISRFASENIEAGNIDRSLSVIYADLMDNDLLSHDLYQRMTELLSTVNIHTDNSLVVSVLVFHREFNEYQESYLHEGSANVRIFTPEACVLFKDIAGNLYYNIAYQKTELADHSAYIRKCMQYSQISRYMLLGSNLEILKECKDATEILEYMFRNIGSGSLRSSYEQQLLRDLIILYSSSSPDREVSDRLISFLKFELDDSTRGKLIEVLIDRKMYREAFLEIEQNGFAGVSSEYVASLSHMMAELSDYEPDPLMTDLCCKAYMETPFDPVIFKYMCRNYDRDIDVLLSMYDKAHENHVSDTLICERLLRLMTTGHQRVENSPEIFKRYFEVGDDRELVKDYMILMSDLWLYEKDEEADFIFEYIGSYLEEGNEFPDRVAVAFLLHTRRIDQPENRILKLAGDLLKDLVRRSIMLEEFKDYGRYFKLPTVLTNTYIAEIFDTSRAAPEDEHVTAANLFAGAPVISYEFNQRGGTVKGSEAMKEVVEGIYCHYFTLFFGESVMYSIDNGSSTVVTYNDLEIVNDGSRYSAIDRMIRLIYKRDDAKLEDAIEDYYIRNELIERLF